VGTPNSDGACGYMMLTRDTVVLTASAPAVQAGKPPHAFPFFILHIFSVFLQFRVPNAQPAGALWTLLICAMQAF
jgi:hypothetical protein